MSVAFGALGLWSIATGVWCVLDEWAFVQKHKCGFDFQHIIMACWFWIMGGAMFFGSIIGVAR